MNKSLILAPISVMAFVIVLLMMYTWVGNMPSESLVMSERPEMNLVHQTQPFSSGLGTGPGSQMQLIQQNTTFPSGIGHSQIRLINQNQTSVYMGLDLTELTAALARELNIPPKSGVYIRSIVPDSPAMKAGIKTGDVLLKCNHQPVTAREQVSRALTAKKAGDVIKVLLSRNGHKKSFHVKLATKPNGIKQVAATTIPVWLGADIQDIDTIMKMQFKLTDQKGVIVSHVAPKSPAAISGLITGDVIRRYNGTRIRNVNQFQLLVLKGQPGDQATLSVLRNNKLIAVSVTLGQHSPTAKKIPFISPADIAIEGTWIGMDVSELSANDATTLNLPASTRGILVNDVESPPAMTLGFQTGDVLTAINGVPVPDMKAFVAASKHQSGAVVDVIRGNKHFFMTVPPPGYTRQGTQLKTGTQHFQKVALNTPLKTNRLAVLVVQPELNASVANAMNNPFIILVDMNKQAYAVLNPVAPDQLYATLQHYQVNAVICGGIDRQTSGYINTGGIVVYSGVVGSAQNAIKMFSESKLISMAR